MIRVLSIDGGGIRGIIPATILTELESYIKEYSGDEFACLAQYFDLVAGTSTGAIITCFVLAPTETNQMGRFSAKEILDIYVSEGKEIFSQSWWQKIRSGQGLFRAKYTSAGLERLSNRYFSKLKLSELVKPCLIPAYNMQAAESVFFNQKTGLRDSFRDFFVKDILRGSTAAPTFFSPVKIKDSKNKTYTLIDGGVFANNPAICAYVEAFKLDYQSQTEDIMILSLGTGMKDELYDYETIKNWGAARWAMPLLSIFGSSASETVDHQLMTIFRLARKSGNYLRINGDIDSLSVSSKLDDVSDENIKALQVAGEKLTKQYEIRLRSFAKRIVDEGKNRNDKTKVLGYRIKK